MILRGFGILQAANPLERSLDQTRGAQTRSAQTRGAQTRGAQTRGAQTRGARHRTSHWPRKARDTGSGLRRLPCSGSFNYYTPHGLCQRSGRHRGRSVCQHTHRLAGRSAPAGCGGLRRVPGYLRALQLHFGSWPSVPAVHPETLDRSPMLDLVCTARRRSTSGLRRTARAVSQPPRSLPTHVASVYFFFFKKKAK